MSFCNYLVCQKGDTDKIIPIHDKNKWFWDSISDKRLMIVETEHEKIETYAIKKHQAIDKILDIISCIAMNRKPEITVYDYNFKR